MIKKDCIINAETMSSDEELGWSFTRKRSQPYRTHRTRFDELLVSKSSSASRSARVRTNIWPSNSKTESRAFSVELDDDTNIFYARPLIAKSAEAEDEGKFVIKVDEEAVQEAEETEEGEGEGEGESDGDGDGKEAAAPRTGKNVKEKAAPYAGVEDGDERQKGQNKRSEAKKANEEKDRERLTPAVVDVRTSADFLQMRQEVFKRRREELQAAFESDEPSSSGASDAEDFEDYDSDDGRLMSKQSFTSFDGEKTFVSSDLRVRVPKRVRQRERTQQRKVEREIQREHDRSFQRERRRRRVCI